MADSIQNNIALASRCALEREGTRTDRDADRDQNNAEPKRQRELALAGFQRNGSRHCARDAANIAADHDNGADFGNRTPEREQEGRQQTSLPDMQQLDDDTNV